MIRDTLTEKDRLSAIQYGLFGFLVDKMVNPEGKHHYHIHPIGQL